MTAPSYTTDLKIITSGEAGTWGEITGYIGGGTPSLETDYFIQNTGCYSQSTGGKTGLSVSMYFDYGSDLATYMISGETVVLFWQVVLAANAVDTYANGGLRLGIGSGVGDFNMWKSGGKDYARYPYGGWQNTAMQPNFTADYPIGVPTSAKRYFASQPNFLSGVSKGNMHAMDAIRYGSGEFLVTSGETSNYATFAGMASTNDSIANRWGLFQAQAGSYLWKGRMKLGSATAFVDFRDSDRNIAVDDTPRTYEAFNKIEVRNTNSRVDWTRISFTALGTLARGRFECVDDADVNIENCSFVDMDTFIFKPTSTINNSSFIRCGQVTQGSGEFNNCNFIDSRAAVALVVNDITNILDCNFDSSGTGHAIQGFPSATSYDLTTLSFTGYAASDGSTGNEAIYVTATAGTVTLNVSGTVPSVRTAGATVTVVSDQVTMTLSPVISGSDIVIYTSGTTTILESSQNLVGTSYQYIYDSGDAGSSVDIGIFKSGYTPFYIRNYTLGSSNATVPIAQEVDRFYIE